jgi:hypothetical protein
VQQQVPPEALPRREQSRTKTVKLDRCLTLLVQESADSTGLFLMLITRAVSLPDASCASGRKGSTPQLRQETAALRDFNPAHVAVGSFASLRRAARLRRCSLCLQWRPNLCVATNRRDVPQAVIAQMRCPSLRFEPHAAESCRPLLEQFRPRVRNEAIAVWHLHARKRLRVENHCFVDNIAFRKDESYHRINLIGV